MKQLSNVKFIYNQHGCEQGISWPIIADSENNKCYADDGWQILGWCKNPPIDEFKKGFGLMFECQKSTCEAEAGTIVWYHYTANELSEFNINVKDGEKK